MLNAFTIKERGSMGKIYKNEQLSDELIKIKHRGKIYTPDYLVKIILNQGNYVDGNINKKHVIDNSCGDGQFIVHIVDRYVNDFFKNSNNISELKNQLETYIHAIEIDKNEINTCINRCNKLVSAYGIENVNWDFINGDTLQIDKFNNKMDFVVGNPPYVRVHNLNDNFNSVKNYLFGNGGMTDLYIIFYEIGIKMLNQTGVLSYITPSSFFTSVAGTNMRNYLLDNNLIESICDLKHFQAFNATTYTTIVCLNKSLKVDNVNYYEFDTQNLCPIYIDTLNKKDYLINGSFYFSTQSNLKMLRKILCNFKTAEVSIKNGFATLNDKVFINNFDFESKFIIPVIKGSRAKWSKIFYPYDKNGNLISEDELKKDAKLYTYLLSHKDELLNRSGEKNMNLYWYAFGRSQGLKDTYKDKISINTLIRNTKDLKIVEVPAGSGVYSGLYIMSDIFSIKEIKDVLLNDEFGIFVSLLGKYKSGGCYTFSSKDVKSYLDYKLGY